MGLREICGIIALLPFVLVLVPEVAIGQENAIAGSVWSTTAPLPGVSVKVAQKPEINNETRDKDGVYVLAVPRSLKKIDLVYNKDTFLGAEDEIPNDQPQNKRPIVVMQSTHAKAIRELSERELDQITAAAERYRIKGHVENLPPVSEIGEANMQSLAAAALIIRDQAKQHSKEGNDVEAAKEFKKVIDIQKRVDRSGVELAQTLDEYAALRRRTNPAEANKLVQRASAIRYSLIPRESLSYLSLLPSGRYEVEFTGLSLVEPEKWGPSTSKVYTLLDLTHIDDNITGGVITAQGGLPISRGTYRRGELTMKIAKSSELGGKQITISGKPGYAEIVGKWEFEGYSGAVKLKPTFPVRETWPVQPDPITGEWDVINGSEASGFPLNLTLRLAQTRVEGAVKTIEGTSPIRSGSFVDNRLAFVVATPNGKVVFFVATLEGDLLVGEFSSGGTQKGIWKAKKQDLPAK